MDSISLAMAWFDSLPGWVDAVLLALAVLWCLGARRKPAPGGGR